MRLFVDCRWFAQPGQGVVTYLVGLHEALLARSADDAGGIELILGVERRDTVPASLRDAPVEIIELGARGFAWRLLILPFVLRRLKVDVAHFQYSMPLLKLGMRYVVTIHDVLFMAVPQFFGRCYRTVRLPFFRFAAAHAETVLTVSETSRNDIRTFLADRRDIVVVHNGFDTYFRADALEPVAALADDRFVLTIGRVEPRKNYARLSVAFRATDAAAAGTKLVIVGFCAREFAGVIAEVAPDATIVWLERVGEGELNWLLANAAAFVFPSLGEGFGIPVLEALAAGLPCAVATTYPLADVRAACTTFDPADIAAMRRAIDTVAVAPKGADAAALLAHYTWESACDSYLAALRPLAA